MPFPVPNPIPEALAMLSSMRVKIRRLTRSPSPSQLSDSTIDEYINTAYVFDLPEELRMISLKDTLVWFCQPNVDVYDTGSVPGLVDFKNKYISVERPVYISGQIAFYSQSREEFFNLYPIISFRQQIALGNGLVQTYTGLLTNVPVAQNSVSFVTVGPNDVGYVVFDVPNSPTNNATGNLVNEAGDIAGTINYVTGAYSFQFLDESAIPIAAAVGQIVQAQTLPYKPQFPTGVLFYDNKFTLRPIPDRPYKITFDAFVRPDAFTGTANAVPFLQEWWQYLSYLAARKIFEDRSDLDSVNLIMPELERQQDLILRRTLVQQSTQVANTIYNQQGYSGWQLGSGNNNF